MTTYDIRRIAAVPDTGDVFCTCGHRVRISLSQGATAIVCSSCGDDLVIECSECPNIPGEHRNADGALVCDACWASYECCTECGDWATTSDGLCTLHHDEKFLKG